MEPWFEVERFKIKNREKGRKISGVGGAGRIFRGPTVLVHLHVQVRGHRLFPFNAFNQGPDRARMQ